MNKKFFSVGLIILLLIASYFVINKNGAQEPLVFTDEHKVKNVSAFARLYGYVRYFHPSDEGTKVDWDAFLVHGVQQVKHAKNEEDLKETLENLFTLIAPTIEITSDIEQEFTNRDLFDKGSHERYVFWQHLGIETTVSSYHFGRSKEVFGSSRVVLTEWQDELQLVSQGKVFDSFPPRGHWVLQKKISDQLSVYLPIVLPINQKGETIGSNSDMEEEFENVRKQLKSLKEAGIHVESEDARIAGVIKAWNIYQHFYPYIDVVDVHWESILPSFIARVIHDSTYDEYVTSLHLMVEKLQDAGSIITDRDDFREYSLPVRVKEIDNQVIVTEAIKDTPFKVGDIVVSINGVPVGELLTNYKSKISGSVQFKKARSELMLVWGPYEASSQLEILRNGSPITVSSIYNQDKYLPTLKKSEPIQEIKEGIYYIPMNEMVNLPLLEEKLDELANARGIIFDARYYFQGGASIYLFHLYNHVTPSPNLQSPKYLYPDQKGEVEFKSLSWIEQPREPHFQGEMVFLTNGSISSFGEAVLLTVKEHHLGTIIGQPTAGQIGYTNSFQLFDGIVMQFTGQRTLKSDGSQHHTIGVLPNITIEPTIESIQSGQDKYLDKAIEYIESKVN